MDAKAVLVCVFVCAYFGGVYGQVGSLCRPNERLLSCGCPKTCHDPVPNCKGVCKEGCFCEEGQVRNAEGNCVNLSDCPPIPLPYKLETSEPRLHGGLCPEGEEYRFCEPCNRNCENFNPICPAQCAKGCFCKGDLLRDKDGRCVKFDKCSNFIEYIREREKNIIEPIPYRYSCGHNQQYTECQKCYQTCSDPEPVCGKCRTGCFCKDGFVKGPDGKCIRKDECPKLTKVAAHFFTSVEDCSSSEEYYSCGTCEPSCQDPAPNCPEGCTSGCMCRPPMVRHATGLCISVELCPPKCSDPKEAYSCLFGCERRCNSAAAVNCQIRRHPVRCALGCHCRRGLLRGPANTCVEEDQCENKNITTIAV